MTKSMKFNDEYKKIRMYSLKESALVFVLITACFFTLNAGVARRIDINFLFSLGWLCTIILIFMMIKEFVYGFIIMKLIKNGKDIACISVDDIPKKIRFVFEPFFDIAPEDNKKQSFKEKFFKLLPPMLLFTYMFFVFGIFEMYFANIEEWLFSFSDILIPSLIALAIGIALTAVLSIIPDKRFSDIFSICLVTVCILAYIQSTFLNQKTFLDGNAPEISKAGSLLNLILWFVIACIPLYCYRIWKKTTVKIAVFSSLILLFMQIAPLPYMFINGIPSMKNREYDAYCLSGEKQFEVSSEGNVIVFIMDSYYSGYLSDYINKNPEFSREYLSDFTFFDNVTTEYTATALSMPYLLTQHNGDYTMSIIDSNAAAWSSDEANDFYGKMQSGGYKVRFYTDSDVYSGDAKNMVGKIDNVTKYHSEYATDMLPTYFSMLRLSMFRYSPESMKDYFYIPDSMVINQYTKSTSPEDSRDLTKWRESSESSKDYGICYFNADYYQQLTKGLTPVSDTKLCIFQHIYGMHVPFMSIENNDEIEGMPEYDATDDCMTILSEYIDRLKEIGVYENSTIILTADHGAHTDMSTSQPVMLIKPAGVSKDSLTTNTAPGVLQQDLLPTILDCVGTKSGSSVGYSLFELDENMQRTRVIRMFQNSSDFKPAKKCTAVGNATCNSYIEYSFDGRISDADFSTIEGVSYPITDYWW